MVVLIPLMASVVFDETTIARAETMGKGVARMLRHQGINTDGMVSQRLLIDEPGNRRLLLGVVDTATALRVFTRLFAEDEFLSPYGLRSLSLAHRDHPYDLAIDDLHATIDYEAAESTTDMFGGNSNWRGPIWFPLNYLLVSSLNALGSHFGNSFTVEYPTGSGTHLSLHEIAADLRRRLISLFLIGQDDRRPSFGAAEKLQKDPEWRNLISFNEYFNGDSGAGLGASHQTGWTGLVADLIRRTPGTDIVSDPSTDGHEKTSPPA
jgi:hypothetical protein